MAKALFGHVGIGSDLRLATELQRLRSKVRDLEGEVAELRAANQRLTAAVQVPDELLNLRVPDSLSEPAEPALT